MSPRLLSFLAIPLLGMLAVPVQADITKPKEGAGGAPVINTPKPVIAVRGKPVDIELSGITGSTGKMSFHIRKKPKLGKLSEPVSKGEFSAMVRYTPSPDLKGDRDEFTFFARVPGSSTSGDATVLILISDAAPKLDAPPLVEASRVVMGHPATEKFIIRNTGNAPWVAKVPAPHGWHWVAPEGGSFRIEPAGETACEIVCDGATLTNLEEVVPLLGDYAIRFVARIVPPFTVLPKQTTLKWKGDTRTREGSVELQNLDTRPLTVEVEAPEWLTPPGALTLEADKKGVLALSLAGKLDQSLTGTVKLTAGGYVQQVEVKAVPAPAVLAVAAGPGDDGAIHFGKLTAETLPTAKRSVTFRNEGGTTAALILELPEKDEFSFENRPPAEGVTLAAGAEKTFVVLPPTNTAGTHWTKLAAASGDSSVSVIFTAGLDPSAIPMSKGRVAEKELIELIGQRPVIGTRIRTQDEQRKAILMTSKGGFVSDGMEDRKLPRIDRVELGVRTDETITLEWDLPPGDGWTFQLYRAAAIRTKLGPAKTWLPAGDEAKYHINGRRASVTLTGLPPGVRFNFRLQTIAPDGGRSQLGKEWGFILEPPAPSHWKEYWHWYVSGAVGLMALGYWIRKKWKEPISALAA